MLSQLVQWIDGKRVGPRAILQDVKTPLTQFDFCHKGRWASKGGRKRCLG